MKQKQMEMEQYANQRVIEELEDIKSTLKTKSFSEHCIEEVDKRIKELKSVEEVNNRSLLERDHPDFPINRKELKQNKHTTRTGGLSPDTGPRH